MDSLDGAIQQAERRWPGLEFKRKNHHEASAPCPFCKRAVEDGFLIFEDQGYWCRKCGVTGRVAEDCDQRMTALERRMMVVEIENAHLRRKQEEHDKRLSALERMARCRDHISYHQQLDEDARRYWHSEGITDASIEKHLLGFCPWCPTDKHHRPSYTIPYYAHDGKTLLNIRHRLANAPNGDKYRPHMAGLGRQLYNSHLVGNEPEIVVVEGAKKVIVLEQETIPAVGVQGASGFDVRWLPHFQGTRTVYLAFDPDATVKAWKLGHELHRQGFDARVVILPAKPDDFFVLFEGTGSAFHEAIKQARRVH